MARMALRRSLSSCVLFASSGSTMLCDGVGASCGEDGVRGLSELALSCLGGARRRLGRVYLRVCCWGACVCFWSVVSL